MFLVKIWGIFLIFITCSAFGFLKSFSIKKRHQKLSDFCDGLNMFYEYIDQGGTELYIAVKKSFSKCDFLCFENQRFYCFDSDLNRDDKMIIDEFLSLMGTSVKKAECDRIANLQIAIRRRVNIAENDIIQKGKVYQIFGICAGLTIGILLL